MPFDLDILYFFNQTIASPTLDPIMIALTSVKVWTPVYILVALLLIYYKRWVGVRLVVSTAVLVGLVNLTTNVAVKPLVARERPCAINFSSGERAVPWVRLPDGMRLGYSFPSSHAVNNFAGVVFFIVLYRRRKSLYWLLVPATIVSLTRPYLGLHYPSDIFGGMLLGALCGYGWVWVHRYFERRLFPVYKSV